jgi:hypothetical protein
MLCSGILILCLLICIVGVFAGERDLQKFIFKAKKITFKKRNSVFFSKFVFSRLAMVELGQIPSSPSFHDKKDIESLRSKSISTFQKYLELYSTQLESRPYTTTIISSAVIGGFGDLLTQFMGIMQDPVKNLLDFRRIIVFSIVAGCAAPIVYIWFNTLNKLTLPRALNSNFARALAMVLVDQTLFAPLINAVFFFVFELVSTTVIMSQIDIVAVLFLVYYSMCGA